jgi:putative ATPase
MDNIPLAAQLRPQALTEFFGQEHLVGVGKAIWRALRDQRMHSMILWGPPGTGKTTLANLFAQNSKAQFLSLSAVMAGLKEIREAITNAEETRAAFGQETVLFIDEVHLFNKTQQNAFLPYVENGTITFIGATTENPSYELNNALLSRVRIYTLHSLQENELLKIIDRALTDPIKGFGKEAIIFETKHRKILAQIADGDARRALNLLDQLVAYARLELGKDKVLILNEEKLNQVLTGEPRRFDKRGDSFFDQISALHKAVRGSSPDAALYWFARMIDGGCDPLYIARRVVRMATEDIGNADPRALTLALNAWDTLERLGSPEGELAIAQAISYCAVAAKSNAVYMAYKKAMIDAKKNGSLPIPAHLSNGPQNKAYRYDHDEPNAFAAGQKYFPKEMGEQVYYHPVSRGLELQITEKLKILRETQI